MTVDSRDQTATTSGIPAWAIIMVIVFIWFFLLSLLFCWLVKNAPQGASSSPSPTTPAASGVEHVPIQAPHWRNGHPRRVSFLQTSSAPPARARGGSGSKSLIRAHSDIIALSGERGGGSR